MSRSYKKAIFQACANKDQKHKANATVRHAKDVPNGKCYRKYFESYNIVDQLCNYRFKREINPFFTFEKKLFKKEGKRQYWHSWK